MDNSQTGNITLSYLEISDYKELKAAMIDSYRSMAETYWRENQIETLLNKFPQGQVVIRVNDQLAGCALSIVVDEDLLEGEHTYRDITSDFTFENHSNEGDLLYGIDVFIKPEFRGLRLGRRLYDYRKELCEKLNLKGIVFGGRIPNYHKHADKMTPKEYMEKVKLKEIYDPVLNFQLANDFHPARIMGNYLEGDS